LDGIVLPKVETPDQLSTIDWLITQLERDRGLDAGMIDLIPIIETGKGLAVVENIAHAPQRVRRLSFGAGDFSLDMNIRWTMEEHELDYARAKIATASRAARLESPLDTVFIHLGVLEGLRSSSERARNFGFQGKLCIHPEQIEPVNQVFSPSSEEIKQAQKYVDAFKAAEASGSASIQVEGYFIDYPIVEKAQRTLDVAKAIEQSTRRV
jgi:citrate lyase subunit beta/citryl-CoA lyase